MYYEMIMEKKTDSHQIKIELALLSENSKHLNEKLDDIKKTIEKYTSDYEERLRQSEKNYAVVSNELAILDGKMKVFNLIQAALTAIAAIITYWFSKVN